jgi:hypothetical protein
MVTKKTQRKAGLCPSGAGNVNSQGRLAFKCLLFLALGIPKGMVREEVPSTLSLSQVFPGCSGRASALRVLYQ